VGTQGGLTALLHAARQGHREAVFALLDGGADINKVSGDHTSPLLIATMNGHFDLVLELLKRGADPNLPSDAGATPLFVAINLQWAPRARYPQPRAHDQQIVTYLDVMKALLEAGADPNARNKKHLWYTSFNFCCSISVDGATAFWRAAYGTDVEAMKLLVAYGADPNIPTRAGAPRARRGGGTAQADPSGVSPTPEGGPAVFPLHAASGVGYGEGFESNAHRHVPGGWLPAVKYLVEELGADVHVRDLNGYNAVHHAASRGDNELIRYLVSKGADVKAVSRRGQTTADMANGPYQRTSPYPETIALLEGLGSKNNHKCVGC
jgi:ankyrin repeat protein